MGINTHRGGIFMSSRREPIFTGPVKELPRPIGPRPSDIKKKP